MCYVLFKRNTISVSIATLRNRQRTLRKMKMTTTIADMLFAFILVTLNVGVKCWINDGKNFIVACPSLQSSSPTVHCRLHIMGSEGTQINITGTMTGLPKTETISSALLLRITVQENYPKTQLLVITTSDDVSIFVENLGQAGPSMYLSIPLADDLTQAYTGSVFKSFLMAFPISSPEQNMFIVGSAYDNTDVTLVIKSTGPIIYNTFTYNDGQTLAVTLLKGQVLEIITEEDLTGTYVESTKPVGVFTGTTVQSTLEQVPPLSKWEQFEAVVNFDFCNNIVVRILASINSTGITISDDSASLTVSRNTGEYYDHVHNATTMVNSQTSLVGIRCTLGSGDKPLAMILPPGSAFGSEFKCLTLSGYNNTAYMAISTTFSINDTLYNVSGADTLFKHVDKLGSVGLDTMRANVPDGYLIIKAMNSDPIAPYIIGFKSDGAYGYPCAKGTLGSLLPDASNSLIDIPLAVLTPSPTSTTVMIESSSVQASSTGVVESSSAQESSPIMIESSSNILTSTESVVATSPFSLESTLAMDSTLTTSTESSAVSSFIMPSSSVQMTTSMVISTSPESSTALSTVTVSPGMQEVCFCRCGENEILPNETKAFLEKYDIEIKRNLTLDQKTLSSYIRTKTSAEDGRPSAQNVGYFGICMLCVTGVLLLFADLLNLFKVALPKQKNS